MTDKYVDGFVLPDPAKKIDAYKQFSAKAGAIWKDKANDFFQDAVGREQRETSFGQRNCRHP
jgi:uncharacterized protein YbaA (DUF1428 family)